MKSLFSSLAAVTVLIVSATGFAWGPTGHRVVAQIAEQHLDDGTRLELRKLLNGRTLPDVANWADEIKVFPQYSKISYLHYADIPAGVHSYQESPVPAEGNTVVAINALVNFLKTNNPSAFEKVPALAKIDRASAVKLLVHFVGDIHQPLHVGDPADKGGNTVKVNWMNRWTSNLHAIWDDEMIDFERMSYTEYARYLDHATTDEIKSWQTLDPVVWTNESLALRDQCYVYNDPQTAGQIPFIGYLYISKSRDVFRQRLLQGGIRLAYLLNSLISR